MFKAIVVLSIVCGMFVSTANAELYINGGQIYSDTFLGDTGDNSTIIYAPPQGY